MKKDKEAKKNIYISLENPLIELDETTLQKIRANIKAGIFGVLGSPKVGLVFHGKDVLSLIEKENEVQRSTLFLDFPKRIAKLAYTRHQWEASLRPLILPPVVISHPEDRFQKFYGRELPSNTQAMNISLTFQSDDIPPIYKFDMKQEFNGFLKYPREFVEKYQCDQIGNKALYMLKVCLLFKIRILKIRRDRIQTFLFFYQRASRYRKSNLIKLSFYYGFQIL